MKKDNFMIFKMLKKMCFIFLCTVSLHAEQFSVLFYNDTFVRTDHHFTNGLSLSWLDDTFENKYDVASNDYSRWMYTVADVVSFGSIDPSLKHTAGVGLSQIIVTPNDLTQSVPQYDDVSYAGYLALSFFFFEWDNTSFSEYRVETGVVGKESGAGWLQKNIHHIIGDTEPKGWDTQLGTDWIFNVLFRQGYKSWRYHSSNGLSMDWFNHFGVQAGNFRTDAFAGSVFRLGMNYIENFNISYPYLKEEASLLRSYANHHGFGWSVSAGLNGDVLWYSYIFEESKNEGYSLEENTLNISPYIGASLYYDDYKITFFYQTQSFYLNEKRETDAFGGFKFDVQF